MEQIKIEDFVFYIHEQQSGTKTAIISAFFFFFNDNEQL